MKRLLFLSVLSLLLLHATGVKAAPPLSEGPNEATEVISTQEDVKVTGTVEAINDTSVTIDGVTYTIDANTNLDDGLQVGVAASLEFVTLADGSFMATEVETDAPDGLNNDQDENEAEDEDIDEQEVEQEDEQENEHETEPEDQDDHDEQDNSGHHDSGDSDESGSDD